MNGIRRESAHFDRENLASWQQDQQQETPTENHRPHI